MYDDLHLARVYHSPRCRGGVRSDEPLISLAMAKAGLRATDDLKLDIMFAPERPRFAIDIDVLAGACSFMRLGRIVRPVIPHFVGARDCGYAYLRETLRLEAARRGRPAIPGQDSLICIRAYGKSKFLNLQRLTKDWLYRYSELILEKVRRARKAVSGFLG